MKKAMIFLLSCLLLTACDRGDEVKGWCVGKAHRPARCEYRTWATPKVIHHPETWNVWIADSVFVRPVCVSQETYNDIRKGEYVRLKH